MMRRRLLSRLPLLLLPLLSFASAAAAQQCTTDDTPLTCWRRFNSVAATTAIQVSATNTGTSTSATLASATAVRDFLSLFTMGVDVGTVTTSGTVVTIDWNLPFPYVEDNDRIKLQTLLSESDLAADVQTALGSNTAAAKSRLTNFDDVTMIAAYDAINARLGRSIAPHTDFLNALDQVAIDNDPAVYAQKLGQLIVDLHTKVPNSGPVSIDTKFSTIPDPVLQQAILAQVQATAVAEKGAAAKSKLIVNALTQLINNQPQLYGTATYHHRSDLVGPDELGFKGTFELSARSLNRFLNKNSDVCAKSGAKGIVNPANCADRLTAYAAAGGQTPTSDRLAFSIEYNQERGGNVDLTEFGVVPPATPVIRKQVHSLIASLTWGHPLPSQRIKDARLDLAVNYDNVSNDPNRKDRLVASITFSQKINDTLTLPISLTYANHEKFLPETDRKLGVHFGISYKIPDSSGGQ
jgi:hypothetical protein